MGSQAPVLDFMATSHRYVGSYLTFDHGLIDPAASTIPSAFANNVPVIIVCKFVKTLLMHSP